MGLFGRKLLGNICVRIFVPIRFHFSGINAPECNYWAKGVNCMFNFLSHCQTVSPLTFPPQCVRGPAAPVLASRWCGCWFFFFIQKISEALVEIVTEKNLAGNCKTLLIVENQTHSGDIRLRWELRGYVNTIGGMHSRMLEIRGFE